MRPKLNIIEKYFKITYTVGRIEGTFVLKSRTLLFLIVDNQRKV